MPVTFTNKHGIPEEFERLLKVDRHVTQGDISVTQLIDSPQIRQLKRTHEYELDVSNMLNPLLGTGLHAQLENSDILNEEARILSKAASILKFYEKTKASDWIDKFVLEQFGDDIVDHHVIREQTLSIEVDGMVISGTQDLYDSQKGVIKDYKVTSVWLGRNKEEVQKFERQQNIYAAMRRENGYDVNQLKIVAFYRDFNSAEAKRSKNYPKLMVEEHDLKLWDHEDTMKYIKDRVKLHRAAEQGQQIDCTAKDRWAKQDKYAVKKKDGKKALSGSITTSKKEAEKFILLNEDKYKEDLYIEFRPGGNKRCEEFCPVRSVCPQYKKILEDINDKSK